MKSTKDKRCSKFFAPILSLFFMASGLGTLPAVAEELNVPIDNPSFEENLPVFTTASFLDVPEWEQSGNGGADVYNVGNGKYPQPSDGRGVCRIFTYTLDDAGIESPIKQYVYQTLAEDIEPNTQYTLAFDAGNPSGGDDDNVVISAYLVAGNTVTTEDAKGVSLSLPLTAVADGSFLQDRKITYRPKHPAGSNSQPLSIVFVYENLSPKSDGECMMEFNDFEGKIYCYTSIAYIDNVRLTARSLRPDSPGMR